MTEVDPRWYQDLVELAPDAAVLIDSEGRIVLVNQQTERLFGYPRQELIGQRVEVLVPERFRRRHTVHRDGYFGEPKMRGMGTGVELSGLRKDGTEFPVEISLSPLRTAQGLFATASIRDASERRRAQQKFKDLLETAPDAMIILDAGGVIRLVNAQAERLFGYQRESLTGKPVEILVPERLRDRHAGHRANYFHSPKVRGMGAGLELAGRRKDGSEFPIEISLSPLQTEDGLWATAAVRDITERKAVEHKLARYTEDLERSNHDLGQFAYVASHDLRAPLRSLMSFSQLLRRRYGAQLDSGALEYLGFIEESAQSMQQLIDDLLAFSRIGQGEPEQAEVDFESLLAEIKHRLAGLIAERGVVITQDPLPCLRGTRHELGQLLQNLIGNAIKFQPGADPKVHIGVRREGDFWSFSVRDQGIGIAPEHQERIFKIFQRLHTSDQYEGSGVGLAVCEKIVRRHGGRIWVESAAGEGSTFHFTLPAA